MPSLHHRNGFSKLNGQHNSNKNKSSSLFPFSSSSTTTAVKKFTQHPNTAKAIFISVCFSWVAIVSLFLAGLPPPGKHTSNADIMSPLTARELFTKGKRKRLSLRAADTQHHGQHDAPETNMKTHRTHFNKKNSAEGDTARMNSKARRRKSDLITTKFAPKDGVAALLQSLLPENRNHRIPPKENMLKQLQAIRQNRLYNDKETNEQVATLQQSTLDALYSSSAMPYVQISTDSDLPSIPSDGISAFAAEKYNDKNDAMGDNDDTLDTYYAHDDETIRGKREGKKNGHCTQPEHFWMYKPTCNEVHSLVSGTEWLAGDEYIKRSNGRKRSKYLASGAYRQVFRLETPTEDEVIFKSMKRLKSKTKNRTFEERNAYNPEEVYKNFELYDSMRVDSMVMELLSSSPRIADIYSFCSLSSIIEFLPGNMEDVVLPTGGGSNDERPENESIEDIDPTPKNDNIIPQEKLEIALEFAKGLAAMHGFKDGVLANVDVQIGQFCRGRDGMIKILDFNRAEALLYDEKAEEYCTFSEGVPPDGSQRSPEEIIDAQLTEKIDVYSLGNLFYELLTGLYVNRGISTSKAHYRLRHGKTEPINERYFNSRSPQEAAILKAIKWCWTFEVVDRPSIFDIVAFLEDEVKKNLDS